MSDVVYVIGAPESLTVKIGVTNDVERRLREIQHMSPVPLVVLWTTPGGQILERALHRHFSSQRTHGEWFAFEENPVGAVQAAVDALLDDLPLATAGAPAEAQKQPLDLPGILYGSLARFYGDGTRFTPVEVAHRFGYTLPTTKSHLEALTADGRTRERLPIRSDRDRQEYTVVVSTRRAPRRRRGEAT